MSDRAVKGVMFFVLGGVLAGVAYMALNRQFPLQKHADRITALEARVDKLEKRQ